MVMLFFYVWEDARNKVHLKILKKILLEMQKIKEIITLQKVPWEEQSLAVKDGCALGEEVQEGLSEVVTSLHSLERR